MELEPNIDKLIFSYNSVPVFARLYDSQYLRLLDLAS